MAIEERFTAALGYTEHQRHCGVHKNTANLHMHIAYNMIHPEKHTRHEPFRDYWKRDTLCRELEQEYGLVVDNGRNKEKQRSVGEKAALIEAHTQANNPLNRMLRTRETPSCMFWQQQRIGKRSMRGLPGMVW